MTSSPFKDAIEELLDHEDINFYQIKEPLGHRTKLEKNMSLIWSRALLHSGDSLTDAN